jgi:multiple sugar transport system ATP-binding protein
VVAIPERMVGQALKAHVGNAVTLGIRPEDIQAVDQGQPHDIEATIALSERLGAEINLITDCHGSKLTVRVPSTFDISQETIALRFDPDRLHLFDKETEEAIAH